MSSSKTPTAPALHQKCGHAAPRVPPTGRIGAVDLPPTSRRDQVACPVGADAGFPAICPTELIPQGDRTFLIRPGRPIQRLTVSQFAGLVGLSPSSVYRYIGSDALPDRCVVYAGKRKILILAAAVAMFLDYFARRRTS